ncbi:hypothetical protein A0J61_08101 [Choanephora cucurbitarum]|uniref:Pleckstrin homology domain-containing protein n=1 Tax=Choanephora cucurbitarum TaxID=101091 RepID=A0A1C7N935_9FUNG|nr:hypothetical protein A0J61_08101 [Choanephora cucurbitarum]
MLHTTSFLGYESPELSELYTNKTSTEYTCVGEAPVTFRRLTPRPVRKQAFQEHSLQTPDSLLMQGDAALASLKVEIADKQQEITYLMNSKAKAEGKYKDEIWSLELEKQDLLQRINDLTNNLVKSNLDLARLEQQEKSLFNELEHLKMLRDEEMNETKIKHEQEVMAYKEMLLVQRTEKERALKELQRLNQKPQLRSNSVILRPISQRTNDCRHADSASIASAASPPQSRSMFAVGQSQSVNKKDESLEMKSLRISLDQAHDIIKSMQDRINKETEERTKTDKLLREAQEMAEHFRNSKNRQTAFDSNNRSLKSVVGQEHLQRKKSKKIMVSEQIPISLLSEELERCQKQPTVDSFSSLKSQKEMKKQALEGEEMLGRHFLCTGLQQVCTSSIGLKPNVATSTICQTSPHLYQARNPPILLRLRELDSFTNSPTTYFADKTNENVKRDTMSFLEGSLKKENDLKSFAFSDKKNNQQSSNAPVVDFNTQVSLDLLLKPLSKDQIQEVLAALTRCIIGEWVWKYTRKVVGVGFSEKKHRRFFWINPYTRVLHWSTHKPGSSAQAHSKSGKESFHLSVILVVLFIILFHVAFVESFRIICDNKKASTVPYLLIKTSERNVKIQCLDLDCHYSWVKV